MFYHRHPDAADRSVLPYSIKMPKPGNASINTGDQFLGSQVLPEMVLNEMPLEEMGADWLYSTQHACSHWQQWLSINPE